MDVTDRFRELDLVNRVPEELGMGVHNTVQWVVTRMTSEKNKCKKAKWLSEEALQISEERRTVKDKGEKARYIHLNTKFKKNSKNKKEIHPK